MRELKAFELVQVGGGFDPFTGERILDSVFATLRGEGGGGANGFSGFGFGAFGLGGASSPLDNQPDDGTGFSLIEIDDETYVDTQQGLSDVQLIELDSALSNLPSDVVDAALAWTQALSAYVESLAIRAGQMGGTAAQYAEGLGGLAKGLGALAVALEGYSIYQSMQANGATPENVSAAIGLIAGVAAGWATGAAVGGVFGGPAGALVGAFVGAVVGAVGPLVYETVSQNVSDFTAFNEEFNNFFDPNSDGDVDLDRVLSLFTDTSTFNDGNPNNNPGGGWEEPDTGFYSEP